MTGTGNSIGDASNRAVVEAEKIIYGLVKGSGWLC